MKATEFKEQTIVFAKDQPQYSPLPAFRNPEGDVVTCWELSPEELEQVKETGKIYLKVKTFNQPLQPIFSSILKHEVLDVEPEVKKTTELTKEYLEGKGFVFVVEENGIFQQFEKEIGEGGKKLILAITPMPEIFVWVPDTECGSEEEDGARVVLDVEDIDKAILAAELIAGIEID